MADSGGPLASTCGSSYISNGEPLRKSASKPPSNRRRRGFIAWALSLSARLGIWYAIIIVLVRCQSSIDGCDDTSPFICEHYLRAKEAVSPHLQPYYNQYAAPYVDVARPYYDAVNNRLLIPTRAYAMHYGAPWARKGQHYAWSQWELNGQPRLAQLQTLARRNYDQHVAPHLARVGDTVEPYYQIARTNSLQLFYEYVLPSYNLVRPHAARGYIAVSDFAVKRALPATHWAWEKSNVFLETTVWPQLRLVYVENVEPQLVRIGERLGRYKNEAKSKVLPKQPSNVATSSDPARSSFSKPTPQSSTPEPTDVESNPATDAAGPDSPQESAENPRHPVQAPSSTENETDNEHKVREMVVHDLKSWQKKIAAQAKEGAAESEERTKTIANRFIQENAKVEGRRLVERLNSTVQSELAGIKRKIVSIADDGSEDAEERAVAVIRSAGLAIKGAAQAVRKWHDEYTAELEKAVLDAANEFFVILGETQNLALQKIGMKWAWVDGISYRDWEKYHELRQTLSKWTDELKEQITRHPTWLEAQQASAQMEDEAMEIAAAAAEELARLKQVAGWKLAAGDSTDDFDSDAMRLAAESAQEARRARATAAETPAEIPADVHTGAIVGAATEAASLLSEAVLGSTRSQESTHKVDQNSEPGGAAAQKPLASEDPVDAAETTMAGASRLPLPLPFGTAKRQLLGTPDDALLPEEGEGLGSVAAAELREVNEANSAEDARTAAGQSHRGDGPPVNSHMFGAAAQAVSGGGPVLDETVDVDMYASATEAAQAAYTGALSAASAQYSSARSVVSAQVYGTPKPVHKQLFSVSAAYENAVDAAGQRLRDAVQAASQGVYSEPTPTAKLQPPGWEKVESMAAQRLSEGRLWAEIQYQSALIALGVATATPTPSSAADQLVEQARLKYYAGIGVAQDRYMSFLSRASSAWSSVTATATNLVGTASSVASAAAESASSASHAAGSAYSAMTEGVASAANAAEDSSSVVDAAGEQVYLAGSALAGTWDKVVSEVSAQVYGEATAIGWYEEVAGAVGSYASAATKTAGDTVCSATEAASAKAAQQYEAMSEMVSELVRGKEPAFSESVLSRLGAIYATA